jgi:type VI secretion system protein ImpM
MSDNGSFSELGFYGKLPTYGDFIQKRLPQDFINPWHEWLQVNMLAVREKEPEN